MNNPNLKGNEENPQNPQEPGQEGKPDETTSDGDELTPEQKTEAMQKEIDELKKKNSDSARGAQELLETNKDLKAKLEKSNETLTEQEYSKSTPDWDLLSDNEKAMMKKQVEIEKDLLKMKEKEAWGEDLEKAKDWAKENGYSLSGRLADFKKFCYSDDNKDIKNIIVLAKSFFFDEEKGSEDIEHSGLEKPTGGGHSELKKGEMSTEEAARIRTSNPRLYKKMLMEGKIKTRNIK